MAPQKRNPAPAATGFDYSAVRDAEQVREAAKRIIGRGICIVGDMIEIGRDLIAVKEKLEHGQFQKWIEAEFGWGKTTVRNFINVASNLGDKSATVAHLAPTAIYALSAPSLPNEVRQEVVERLEKGEKFDADQIKRLAKQAKEHVHTARDQAGLASPKEAPIDAPDTAAVVAPPSDLNGQDDAIPEEEKGVISRHEDPVSRVCDFANIIGELPRPGEVARQIIANGHRLADLPSFRSAADWLRAFCEALEDANLRSQGQSHAGEIPEAQRRTRFD